jgi:acetyl-CoA carboxylase/biotin carboxylase 1
VIRALAKGAKDNILSVIPQLIQHNQLKSRVKIVIAILREIDVLPTRFPAFKLSKISDDLNAALSGLSNLEGSPYGEVSLKAKQLLDAASMPDFNTRLETLRSAVLDSSTNLIELALQPNFAVSVDLLTILMSDPDALVRKNAAEVYIRRVYRANIIKSIEVTDTEDGVSVAFAFTVRDVAQVFSSHCFLFHISQYLRRLLLVTDSWLSCLIWT